MVSVSNFGLTILQSVLLPTLMTLVQVHADGGDLISFTEHRELLTQYPLHFQMRLWSEWKLFWSFWLKVEVFWEGLNFFLRNHHLRFVLCSNGQIYSGYFAKFCDLLRIYELYFLLMRCLVAQTFCEKDVSPASCLFLICL